MRNRIKYEILLIIAIIPFFSFTQENSSSEYRLVCLEKNVSRVIDLSILNDSTIQVSDIIYNINDSLSILLDLITVETRLCWDIDSILFINSSCDNFFCSCTIPDNIYRSIEILPNEKLEFLYNVKCMNMKEINKIIFHFDYLVLTKKMDGMIVSRTKEPINFLLNYSKKKFPLVNMYETDFCRNSESIKIEQYNVRIGK